MKSILIRSIALVATTGALLSFSPIQAATPDEAIITATKDSYVFRTFLKDDRVSAQSTDGVVTLTGTVADASHKSLAEDTVANLAGVRKVDNKLTIKSEVAADNSDWWTSFKIKNVLMFHGNVRALETGVNTANGVVTLTGEATSLAQKELTGEYAQDVDGVKSVQNNMTVLAPVEPPVREETAMEKLDDASITAQIKAALLFHRSTSALTTNVQTKEGVVTVGGIAKNAAEKSLVTKLVTDIKGVTKVINDMTIPFAATSQR
jgi:osmotically-inducible protein OsmY